MPRIMKTVFAFWLAAFASGTLAAGPAKDSGLEPLGQIIAIVNDDVITQHELDERIRTVSQRLKRQGTPLPAPDVLKKQLLENMITGRLMAQTAKEHGIRVDDDQLDREMEAIARRNHFKSLEDYRAQLEKAGEDFGRFREEVRNQIIAGRLRARLDARLTITNSEIDNYLANEASQPGRDAEYHVAHILVVIPEQASAAQVQAAEKRANEALAQLRKGANFAQVAAGYSDAQDALRGGDLGWRPSDQFPAGFRDVLAKMRPGEVSGLLHGPNAYHILKLIDVRKKSQAMIITQTHVRHILIKTSDLVPDADAKARILAIKKKIEHGASFAEMARLYSEDGSASQGGDLGWMSPGELVPEFEQAMNALQPGEMSGPVQTTFGWHLIQVLGRRNTDVSEEQKRRQAALAIRSVKSEEAWQDWLRQLRDSAHIEYLHNAAH
ncbi:MAG TPA: peptidylprolyl isomerase [Gallionellaceae bacterium]|nr:peptidylprolyl isomerase [Gallionellaceae bacterium]